MYKGFYIDADEFSRRELIVISELDAARESYEKFCSIWRKEIENSLDKYVADGINGEELDASAIEYDWFPAVKADIFLSHSHADEDLIVDLAAWLHYYLGLNAFIDSRVWSYCDDLLQNIDDTYCRCDYPYEEFLNYSKVKQSASHVYMLLNSALMKMIDAAECFIFAGTVNSCTQTASLNMMPSDIKYNNYSTFSPWIYSELLISRLIRPKFPDRVHVEVRKDMEAILESQKFPSIRYDLDISHLTKLDISTLQQLQSRKLKPNESMLDALYAYSERRY